jgi:hypothetical protein
MSCFNRSRVLRRQRGSRLKANQLLDVRLNLDGRYLIQRALNLWVHVNRRILRQTGTRTKTNAQASEDCSAPAEHLQTEHEGFPPWTKQPLTGRRHPMPNCKDRHLTCAVEDTKYNRVQS